MSKDEATSEAVTAQAVDWLSTLLSIPLIWPKTTALASFALIALSAAVIFQLTTPSLAPTPPLDRARVAEIETAVQQAEQELHAQMGSSAQRSAGGFQGYLHAVADHEEHKHDAPRIHAD